MENMTQKALKIIAPEIYYLFKYPEFTFFHYPSSVKCWDGETPFSSSGWGYDLLSFRIRLINSITLSGAIPCSLRGIEIRLSRYWNTPISELELFEKIDWNDVLSKVVIAFGWGKEELTDYNYTSFINSKSVWKNLMCAMINSNGVTAHFAIAALRLTDEKPPKPETRIINDHWKKTPKVSVKIEGINHEYDLMYLVESHQIRIKLWNFLFNTKNSHNKLRQ